jgi:hypothetical protein
MRPLARYSCFPFLLHSSRSVRLLQVLILYQHEPGKQDTELKLHFTKQDHYLPIGMPALDESGKGRELFTTLVEEKSVVCCDIHPLIIHTLIPLHSP